VEGEGGFIGPVSSSGGEKARHLALELVKGGEYGGVDGENGRGVSE